MKLMPALLKRSRAASPVEDFCEVTRVFDFSMIAHSSFLKNSFNVGVGIGLQQLVADRFIPGRKLLEFSKRPMHDCKRLRFPRRVEPLMARGFALSTLRFSARADAPRIEAAIPAAHNEDATAKSTPWSSRNDGYSRDRPTRHTTAGNAKRGSHHVQTRLLRHPMKG